MLCLSVLACALWGSASAEAALFARLPGEMAERRSNPVAALLPSGKVLVASGYNPSGQDLKTAELFDPATGSFEKLPAELKFGREESASATLRDGKVLLAGSGAAGSLKTAELFNPATNAFESIAAELTVERDGAAAALLPSGKVLIMGGGNSGKDLTSAELYDPEKRTFEAISSQMLIARYSPFAATLPDGRVLVGGGSNLTSTPEYLKSTELFNPATNSFEAFAGSGHEMTENRGEVGVATLPSGKVLIAGGYNSASKSLASAELFNPQSGVFERLPGELAEPRDGSAGALLPDGRVLLAGGYNESKGAEYLKTAEVMNVTAPVVTTAPASSVGAANAILNGTALSDTSSSAYFQYGTSTDYGATTARQTVGASLGPLSVTDALAGLSPGSAYHYRVVAENGGGPSFGADQTFTTARAAASGPRRAPLLTGATQSHARWREGSKLARLSKKSAPVGTTFAFRLDQAATTTFAFAQQTGGRRVNGKCVAQRRSNRHKHACKRTVLRGTLSLSGHAGNNKVSFQGRISRSKKLRPGSYTLLITATNAAGQRSVAQRLTFTIVP